MAFGITPKYVQDLPLNELSPEQFLVLVIEAANRLGWKIAYQSETGIISYTGFSMASWSEEVKVKIDETSANLQSACMGNQVFDWGKNKKNIEQLITAIEVTRAAFTPEELQSKLETITQSLVPKEQDVLNAPPPTTKDKLTGFLAIFKPSEGYFVTPVIININIAIFILMVICGVDFMQPDGDSLVAWGANFTPATLDGGWWRLLTNCFIHIGVLHLLLNMYALVYIGLLLEPHLGKVRFLAAYLLTGVAASLASLGWHTATISAGASGAIFGMYGVFLALLTTNLIDKVTRTALLTSIGIFVVYNLTNSLKAGIDMAAHVGGLVSGVIVGYAFVPSLKDPDDQQLKFLTFFLLVAGLVIPSYLFFHKKSNDIGKYEKGMKRFADMESMALEVYQLPKTAAKEQILSEIKDRGFYYWDECTSLIYELDRLNIPPELHDRDKMLIHYCALRRKSFEFIYKTVDENTEKYKSQLDSCNKAIKAIMDQTGAKN